MTFHGSSIENYFFLNLPIIIYYEVKNESKKKLTQRLEEKIIQITNTLVKVIQLKFGGVKLIVDHLKGKDNTLKSW